MQLKRLNHVLGYLYLERCAGQRKVIATAELLLVFPRPGRLGSFLDLVLDCRYQAGAELGRLLLFLYWPIGKLVIHCAAPGSHYDNVTGCPVILFIGRVHLWPLGNLFRHHAIMLAGYLSGLLAVELYTTVPLCTSGYPIRWFTCHLTIITGYVYYLSDGKHSTIKGKAMTQTAIGYIRVSTSGQVDDGVSLDAQRERIAAYCVANDLELADVLVDAGISGKRADNRQQLQAALDKACSSKSVLIVYSLSRLARSTKDTIEIAERLDRAGADLVSLSEKIDTTTAAGKMVFRMLAVLAEFERDLVSERTTAAMAYKRQRGELVGSIPFGFDLDDDGVTLVPNDTEQLVLELISDLRNDGYSLRAIAAELDRRNISTKTGQGTWQHTTIQRIIQRVAA